MKLERRSEGPASRGARWLVCASGVLCCILGCTAYPTVKPNVPLDCTADTGYDFLPIDIFETLPDTAFFASGDMTSDPPTATVETIPDGPRCNSKVAMLIQSSHHNDWGSVFGFSNFGPRDVSAYEGVSFWARVSGNSTSTFVLLLDDPNSDNGAPAPTGTDCTADAGTPPANAGPLTMCKKYCMPDAGVGAPVTTFNDPATGMAVGGSTTMAPPADACGNDYQFVQVVTSEWRFYTIPFASYQQGYMPNRVPNPLLTVTGNIPGNGLRTSAIMDFTIRLPREADTQLWFDNLQFYRRKKAGSDGGSDAPRM